MNDKDRMNSGNKVALMIVVLMLVSLAMPAFAGSGIAESRDGIKKSGGKEGIVIRDPSDEIDQECSNDVTKDWLKGETQVYDGGFQGIVELEKGVYEIEVFGASGADTNMANGGNGGYVNGTLTAENNDQLELWVGKQGDLPEGGYGYKEGGNGGESIGIDGSTLGGGGGGSTRLEFKGNSIVNVDAGGGAGGQGFDSETGDHLYAAGGGGARGGKGGTGGADGYDANGTGNGGNGGDSDSTGTDPGGDGGFTTSDPFNLENGSTGGSNYSDGRVEITLYKVNVNPQPDDTITDHTGSEYTYEGYFDVENKGDENDTYSLSASTDQAGWSATSQQDSVEVNAGKDKRVYVDVIIPQTAGGECSNIELTATGMHENTSSFQLCVDEYHEVEVSPPGDKTEYISGSKSYSFTVYNHGNIDDTYDLSVTDTKNWGPDVPSSTTVGAQSQSSETITIQIPADAGGVTNDITLTADSQSSSASDSGFFSVSLESVADFSVNMDDINAGQSPNVEIIDAAHQNGTPVEGDRVVEMSINGTTYTETLSFSSGSAAYSWDAITDDGTYTAQVTVDGVMREDSFTVYPADPDSVSVYTQPQDTEAGQTINGPPSAYVEDQYGNELEGVEVTVSVSGGFDSGTITRTTGSDGVAIFDDLVIQTKGSYQLEFNADGVVDNAVSDQFDISSADMDNFTLTVNDTDAGQSPFLELTDAQDQYGNDLDGEYNCIWEIQETSNGPVEVILNFTAGEATYETGEVIEETGSYTAEVTVDGVKRTDQFDVISGKAVSLEIQVHPGDTTAGETIGGPPTVLVTDEYGNPVEEINVTVNARDEDSGEIYNFDSGTILQTTGAEGTAEFNDLKIHEKGIYHLEFGADGITGDAKSNSFEITSSDPDNLSVNTQPQDTEAGQTINGPPEALVVDQYGNGVKGVDVTISEDGGYTFDSGTTTRTTGSGGLAAFNDLVIQDTGNYQLLFDAQGVTEDVVSNSFEITLSDLDHIEVHPQDSNVTAGDTVNYTATAYDEYDNVIDEVTTEVNWSIDDGAGGYWENNTYHSENDGTWTVTAHYEGVIGTAALTVEPSEYTLTIGIDGEGSTDPESGSHICDPGEKVEVEAVPDEHWYFVEWKGDHAGTEDNITITMNDDKEVTAVFEEHRYELNVTVEGNGTVEIDPEREEYEPGTTVDLKADPDKYCYFVEWTGDDEGEASEIKITMNSSMDITAHFEEGEAHFEVEIISFDEEVQVGEEITIEYSVENTGLREGTEDIIFRVKGDNVTAEQEKHLMSEGEDNITRIKEMTLSPGEEQRDNFTMKIEEEIFSDIGRFKLEVVTDQEEKSLSIDVSQGRDDKDEGSFSLFDNYWWLTLIIIAVVISISLIALVSDRDKSGVEPVRQNYQQEPNYGFDEENSEQDIQFDGDVTSVVRNTFKDLGRSTQTQAYQRLVREKGEVIDEQEFEDEVHELVKKEKLKVQPRRDADDFYIWNE